MLDDFRMLRLATRMPRFFDGATLHRAALMAAHQGDAALADRLFEHAVERYRRDLAVESLARLRVHQKMVRVRARRDPECEAGMSLEVERMLTHLSTIESLEPPFVRVDARAMLAGWRSPMARPDAHTEPYSIPLAA